MSTKELLKWWRRLMQRHSNLYDYSDPGSLSLTSEARKTITN